MSKPAGKTPLTYRFDQDLRIVLLCYINEHMETMYV
jgi:hypothetical protein